MKLRRTKIVPFLGHPVYPRYPWSRNAPMYRISAKCTICCEVIVICKALLEFVLDFICCFISKPERIKGDWGRKSMPNFLRFTLLKLHVREEVGEMSK